MVQCRRLGKRKGLCRKKDAFDDTGDVVDSDDGIGEVLKRRRHFT